jgi:ribonuclease VapC
MVLDSSAIVAILLKEAGYEDLARRIAAADGLMIGTPTILETTMVLSSRLGSDARTLLHAFLLRIGAEIVPFSEAHLGAASAAFLRFGRGHHPARLNFGDCMAYAVASLAGMPLLFTGNDFAQTDIAAA